MTFLITFWEKALHDMKDTPTLYEDDSSGITKNTLCYFHFNVAKKH